MSEKDVLARYLTHAREALVWKLDGVSERDARCPMTPTGTNLLGLVKHAAHTEAGYFGVTFGRPCEAAGLVPDEVIEADPQADFYATAGESIASIVDLYLAVQSHADDTIARLDLDAPGYVPWWGERGAITLQMALIHVTADLNRHAGHADILRENLDGSVGLRESSPNVPNEITWADYHQRLKQLADQAERD